jgi:alanine racemase
MGEREFHRPTVAVIHLDAIRKNIRAMQRKIGKARQVMAVVKARGYGHGMVETAQAAIDGGAQQLGVATVDEAVELRAQDFRLPVLVLGPSFAGDAEEVVHRRISVALGSLDVARALDRTAQRQGRKASVHVKVDTGMGRFGFWHEEWESVLPELMLFTHFSDSDGKSPSYTKWQLRNFQRVLEQSQRAGFRAAKIHAANSGAIFQHPDAYFDLVRPGITVYGLYPTPVVERTVVLHSALTLLSGIVLIRSVGKGRYVSYGRTFKAPRRMRIATVPIGYGDGYPRSLSNRGFMIVRGQRVPIVGRVCMDQVLLDVTRVPGAGVGDEVLVYGRKGSAHVPIEEIAEMIGTIPNEVVCALGERVPRLYRNPGIHR